jgi:hypothetical protein
MQDVLSRLVSHDGSNLVLYTLIFLAGMIVWLSLQWRLHRRTEIEAALKQEMLKQGMSAADIERVVRATASPNGDDVEKTDDRRSGRVVAR